MHTLQYVHQMSFLFFCHKVSTFFYSFQSKTSIFQWKSKNNTWSGWLYRTKLTQFHFPAYSLGLHIKFRIGIRHLKWKGKAKRKLCYEEIEGGENELKKIYIPDIDDAKRGEMIKLRVEKTQALGYWRGEDRCFKEKCFKYI